MIEEENEDNKKKTINLKLQHVLLQQQAPQHCWDKWERIQLTTSELDEADNETWPNAKALLKTFENYWPLIR